MTAARSFAVGDKVTVRTGKTVLETYQGEADVCLMLASGKDRQVAYAKECRVA